MSAPKHLRRPRQARGFRRLLDEPSSNWRVLPWGTNFREHGLTLPVAAVPAFPVPARQPGAAGPRASADSFPDAAAMAAAGSAGIRWKRGAVIGLLIVAATVVALWRAGVFRI